MLMRVNLYLLLCMVILLQACKEPAELLKEHNIPVTADSFVEYAGKGNKEVVKLFIKTDIPIDARSRFGETPLLSAVRNNKPETAEILLKAGAETAKKNTRGMPPLVIAADKGYLEMTKLLVSEGAVVELKTDDTELTPLIYASSRGHLDIAKYLISNGAGINEPNKDGGTPLMNAAFFGHGNVVTYLLNEGANPNATLNNGYTALMFAAEKGHVDIIKELLANSADISASMKNGKTAYDIAREFGQKKAAKLLLN